MNAVTNAKNTSGSSGTVRSVVGVIIFVLVCVGLYYLYKFLYGSAGAQNSVTILNSNIAMTSAPVSSAVGGKTAVAVTSISGIMDGGQYSTSFWAYVADTKGFAQTGGASLAHLMEISDNRFGATEKGKTLLFVGLNPSNGSLIVRQSTNDVTSSMIDNNLATSSTTNSSTNYKLDNLITGYNTSGSTYTSNTQSDKSCWR